MADIKDPNFLRFLRCEMEATALRFGIQAQVAKDIAAALEDIARRRYAGEIAYIAKRDHAARRAAVLADLNGRNHAEVCEKHGITKRTLYNYLRAGRKGSGNFAKGASVSESIDQIIKDSDNIFTAISTGDFENFEQAQRAVVMGYVTDMSFSRGGISHALKRLEEFYAERNHAV